MNDLALIAATEWARTNTRPGIDPVEFGHKVALAHLACRSTEYHAGSEKAMAAALAALSVRPEVLQAIAQLASLAPLSTQATLQKHSSDAGV